MVGVMRVAPKARAVLKVQVEPKAQAEPKAQVEPKAQASLPCRRCPAI